MVSKSARSEWMGFVALGRKTKKPDEASSAYTSIKDSRSRNLHIPSSLRKQYGEFSAIVGECGGNTVFAVRKIPDGATFAVKRFRKQCNLEDEQKYTKRVLSEYILGSQLRHGHIVQIIELFEEQNTWYQVMEYVPYNLFDRACSRKMSMPEIDCSFKQIVSGVSYLHSTGLAHRDLKLENVVYTRKGVLKLIDFGTAASATLSGSGVSVLFNDFVGCRPYMAPEILSRKYYKPQIADFWSIAIIYCCMVIGKFPWREAHHCDAVFARFTSSQCLLSQPDHVASEPLTKSCISTTATAQNSCDTAAKDFLNKSGVMTELRKIQGDENRSMSDIFEEVPRSSWEVISKLLHVDPQRRGNLKQLANSLWFQEIQVCCWNDGNGSVNSSDHQHV